MNKAEQATKLWAADRLGLDPDTIESVEFDDRVEYGGYCETCAYEYVTKFAKVRTSDGQRREINLDDTSFSTIITEIGAFVR